jgi:hypothetical protein
MVGNLEGTGVTIDVGDSGIAIDVGGSGVTIDVGDIAVGRDIDISTYGIGGISKVTGNENTGIAGIAGRPGSTRRGICVGSRGTRGQCGCWGFAVILVVLHGTSSIHAYPGPRRNPGHSLQALCASEAVGL